MSRLLDGTDDSLSVDAVPASAVPLSMACWYYPTSDTLGQTLMALLDKDVSNHYFTLNHQANVAGDPIRFASGAGGAAASADTTAAPTLNIWQHACGVAASATDRRVFLNGGSKGTNATSRTPTGLDRFAVGRFLTVTSPVNPVAGLIAWPFVWAATLTDAEVKALASGVNPWRVRPANIVLAPPLWGLASPEPDYTAGQRHLTVNGATASALSPPVQAPPGLGEFWVPSTPPAGGLTLAIDNAGSFTISGATPAAATAAPTPAGTTTLSAPTPAGTLAAAPPPAAATFEAPALTASLSASPSAGAATLEGPTPSGSTVAAAAVGSVTLDGSTPTAGLSAIPPAGSATFDGLTPTGALASQTAPGTVTFDGAASAGGVSGQAPTGQVTFAAPDPTAGSSTSPLAGQVTFEGLAPSLPAAGFTLPVGTVTLSAPDPVPSTAALPPSGQVDLSGIPLGYQTNATVPAGTVTFTGQLPAIGSSVTPPSGEAAFSALVPSGAYSSTLPVGVVTFEGLPFELEGIPPPWTYGGAPAPSYGGTALWTYAGDDNPDLTYRD